MRKLVGFLWLMTLEKLFCESSQTAFLKTAIFHKEHFSILMAAERSKRVEHPTLRITNRLEEKSSTMWTVTRHYKQCKNTESTNSTWHGSQICGNHSLQLRLGHFRVKKIHNNKGAPTRTAREPHGVHFAGGYSASSTEQKMGAKVKEWCFPSVAYGIGNITTSFGRNDFGSHRQVRRKRPRDNPWMQAGDAKVETRTNKSQIKIGESTSHKILGQATAAAAAACKKTKQNKAALPTALPRGKDLSPAFLRGLFPARRCLGW